MLKVLTNIENILDKGFKSITELDNFTYKGYFPQLACKIPNCDKILNGINSLILLDTETNRYIVVKKKSNEKVSGFSVINSVGEILNYHKLANANVVVPILLSKLKQLDLK